MSITASGRYEGLTQIPVGNSPHDCVALEYAGGDKLYVPVENIDVLSRYGSESDGVPLDRLGGEAWQRRKSRMKERIREIAGELIKTAAERALRPGVVMEPDTGFRRLSSTAFPMRNRRPGPRDHRRDRRSRRGASRWTGWSAATSASARRRFALAPADHRRDVGLQVALVLPRPPLLARQHLIHFKERFGGFPIEIGRLSRLVGAAGPKATRRA
jgi:transcription-repair coupling factor (superfamily II helicase)